MRLIGVEVAEVTAPSEAATSSSSKAATSSSSKTASSESSTAGSATTRTTSARSALPDLDWLSAAVIDTERWPIAEIDAGKGICRSILAGNRDRFGRKIGI